MKLCINCKHCTPYGCTYMCLHPDITTFEFSLVDKRKDIKYLSDCKSLRNNPYYSNLCGESGKLYAPKALRKFLIKLKVVDE